MSSPAVRYGVQVVKVAQGTFYVLRVCYREMGRRYGKDSPDDEDLLKIVSSVAPSWMLRGLSVSGRDHHPDPEPFLGKGMVRSAAVRV